MKSLLGSVFFMLILSTVCASVLAFIHSSTIKRVQVNAELKLQKEILIALGILSPQDPKEKIQALFDSNIRTVQHEWLSYYELTQGKDAGAFAFVVSAMGFWAPIHAVVALRPDRTTILGIRFFQHSETSGLGGRISEDWFQNQFGSKRLDPDQAGPSIRLVLPGQPKTENDVDAITGATQTSKKVEQLLAKEVQGTIQSLWPVRIPPPVLPEEPQ